MVVPAVLAGAGFALGSVYTVGKALDSRKYWSDYARHTGVTPRYPWRAGANDYLSYASHTMMAPMGFSRYGRYARSRKYKGYYGGWY